MERATMQVRTHPASQKRAQAAALTLDHCYGAIYDSLEHPPKFNPLAVLRWSRRVEEQRAAKAKWEAEQDIAHSESYSTGPSLSSPSDAVSPLGSRSVSSVPENFVALGWRYRLSDVTAYMACGGKVNFFIPPIEMLPAETPSVVSPAAVSHDERTERTDLLEPPPNIPVQDPARTRVTRSPDAPSPSGYQPAYQPSPSIIRPASTNDLRPRVSLTSSAGEWDAFPSDRAHPQPPSQLSPASPVIVAELLDEANMPSLSRSPSFEGGRPLRAHRSHQNTGSSLHALKEKLGSVARRNISMSVSPQPHDDDELPRRPGWLVADAPPPGAPGSSSQTDLNSALSSQQHTFRDRVRNRLSHVASAGNARLDGTRGDAREAGTGTSEDESGGHFRKLFRGASRQRGSHQHTDSSSRVEQMRALENIVGSERQMRYESTANRHPSERERQAQEGLLLLENQIYEERSALLQLACQRLDDLTATEYQMNKLITHFIATTDQAQATFKNAADVSIKFENIDHLRPTAKITPLAADDESADSVAPLRGEESDRGGFSAGGGFSDRGGSRSAVATRARRRSSLGLATAPLPSLNYVYAAGSRRLIVDPSLGVAFDPIQRVELGCERAREAMVDMSIAREESRRKLGAMVQSINMLIAQKDRVRVWARSTLEEAERLKEERDTIRLRIRGGIRPRLARLADESIDMAARGVLGLMSGGFRLYRMALGRSDSSWIGAVVVLAFGAALLAYFYMTGDPVEAAEAVGAAVDTVVSGDAAAAAAVGAVTDAVVEAV
jgi:hypothetical protein